MMHDMHMTEMHGMWNILRYVLSFRFNTLGY